MKGSYSGKRDLVCWLKVTARNASRNKLRFLGFCQDTDPLICTYVRWLRKLGIAFCYDHRCPRHLASFNIYSTRVISEMIVRDNGFFKVESSTSKHTHEQIGDPPYLR